MKERIAIVLGSKSDLPSLKDGFQLLDELGIGYRLEIISAHRNPEKLRKFCIDIGKKDYEVVIACAGLAAALPGFVASYVDIPVIGVALKGGVLDGLDSIFSIISTPKGLGLMCSGIGKAGFINAIISSLEIIALKDKKIAPKLKTLKNKFK